MPAREHNVSYELGVLNPLAVFPRHVVHLAVHPSCLTKTNIVGVEEEIQAASVEPVPQVSLNDDHSLYKGIRSVVLQPLLA